MRTGRPDVGDTAVVCIWDGLVGAVGSRSRGYGLAFAFVVHLHLGSTKFREDAQPQPGYLSPGT